MIPVRTSGILNTSYIVMRIILAIQRCRRNGEPTIHTHLAREIDMKTYLDRLEHDLIGFSALEITKYFKMSLIRVVTKKKYGALKKYVVVK